MGSAFAEVIPPKSNTTDPSSSKYYDNNAQNNAHLTPEAKNYAIANPTQFDYFIKQNDGKCGKNCADIVNAEALKFSASAGSAGAGGAPAWSDTTGGGWASTAEATKSDVNRVSITTPVPGIDVNDPTRCQCDDKKNNCKDPVTQRWSCTVDSNWLIGFQKIMAEITRVFVYITLLFWVLAIVGLGIGYAIFSGGDEEKTKLIKTYAINLMIGMILLFFFRYILVFLAPWIFQ